MTLWDFDSVMRRSLAHILTELKAKFPGRRTTDLSIYSLIKIRDTVAKEFKKATHEQIRLEAFVRTVRHISGSSDQEYAEYLNARYLKHRFEDIELYPDVVPVLDDLAGRYAVGLVSNGNSYPERCGLPNRFQFLVFSHDVGAEKPDSAIFRAACEKAGCAPFQLMHVGDSLDSDVRGANGVGAVSVWLNRDHRPKRSAIIPDFEIHSLTELCLLIGCE
jgi:putative hydrolase of the HAD superfamily